MQGAQCCRSPFSVTADLTACFPRIARAKPAGYGGGPCLIAKQMAVEGDLPRCIGCGPMPGGTRPFRPASLFAPGQPSSVRTDPFTSDSWRAALPPLPCCGSGQRMGLLLLPPTPGSDFHALPQPSSPAFAGDAFRPPARSPAALAVALRPALALGGLGCRPVWCRCGPLPCAAASFQPRALAGLVVVSLGETIANYKRL